MRLQMNDLDKVPIQVGGDIDIGIDARCTPRAHAACTPAASALHAQAERLQHRSCALRLVLCRHDMLPLAALRCAVRALWQVLGYLIAGLNEVRSPLNKVVIMNDGVSCLAVAVAGCWDVLHV